MAPLLLAALVLLPTAALGTSTRDSHRAGIHMANGPVRLPGPSRAKAQVTRKRGKARPAGRNRRRLPPPRAVAGFGGALPFDNMSLLDAKLDLRGGCSLRRECGAGLHARMFGEREVEGLVRAADDLYTGAVLRDRVGFWLWARPSTERLTLSPIASPGDQRYGLYITGCFE